MKVLKYLQIMFETILAYIHYKAFFFFIFLNLINISSVY